MEQERKQGLAKNFRVMSTSYMSSSHSLHDGKESQVPYHFTNGEEKGGGGHTLVKRSLLPVFRGGDRLVRVELISIWPVEQQSAPSSSPCPSWATEDRRLSNSATLACMKVHLKCT